MEKEKLNITKEDFSTSGSHVVDEEGNTLICAEERAKKNKLIALVVVCQTISIIVLSIAFIAGLSHGKMDDYEKAMEYSIIEEIVEREVEKVNLETEVDYDKIEEIVERKINEAQKDFGTRFEDATGFLEEKTEPARDTAREIIQDFMEKFKPSNTIPEVSTDE